MKRSILIIAIILCLLSCANYYNPNFNAPSGVYQCIEVINENHKKVEPYKDEKEVLLEGNKVYMGESIGYLLPKGNVKVTTYYPPGYKMQWEYEGAVFTITIKELKSFSYVHYRRLKYILKK